MVSLKVYDNREKNNNTTNIIRYFIISSLLFLLLFFFLACSICPIPPLNQAAWDNNLDQIKTLIEDGAGIDEDGGTPKVCFGSPLDLAIVQGNIEAVELLLELGADVNLSRFCYADTPNGYYKFQGSALMLSSLMGDIRITEMLLKAGADVNQLTGDHLWTENAWNGYDALQFSAEMGHSEIAELLIKYGADVNAKDERGGKAAHTAIHRGHSDYVFTLLENGLEIESDTMWAHYNAEIAHLAADRYASSNEEKSIELYKKAIELYPQGIENYGGIADRYKFKENFKTMISLASIAFGAYAAQTQAQSMANDIGTGVGTWVTPLYKPDMTQAELYSLKAQTSGINYEICKEILNCYENHENDMKLIDCSKNIRESYENQD